jgi:hypothetical protein
LGLHLTVCLIGQCFLLPCSTYNFQLPHIISCGFGSEFDGNKCSQLQRKTKPTCPSKDRSHINIPKATIRNLKAGVKICITQMNYGYRGENTYYLKFKWKSKLLLICKFLPVDKQKSALEKERFIMMICLIHTFLVK